MKTTLIISIIIVGILAGCKNEESIPTKPNNNQTSDSGILAGYASYTSQLFEDRFVNSMDLSGVKVELVGTDLKIAKLGGDIIRSAYFLFFKKVMHKSNAFFSSSMDNLLFFFNG